MKVLIVGDFFIKPSIIQSYLEKNYAPAYNENSILLNILTSSEVRIDDFLASSLYLQHKFDGIQRSMIFVTNWRVSVEEAMKILK